MKNTCYVWTRRQKFQATPAVSGNVRKKIDLSACQRILIDGSILGADVSHEYLRVKYWM